MMDHVARIAAQYDALAEVYDRFFSDKLAELLNVHAPLREDLQRALQQAGPSAAILDCACGPGRLVLGLAKRGRRVWGTDASQGMIRVARRRARTLGLKPKFAAAQFAELPRKLHRRFDVVICGGNAIGHCHGERGMLAGLRGIHAALRPGGAVFLDTRCWETYRRQRVRFDTFAPKTVEDERLIWLNVRHYPRQLTAPHLIEVVIISDRGGQTSVQSFPVTYYPFRVADLKRRLRVAGFEDIRTIYLRDANWYRVAARRAL
jgi:SAM-dependent methyltransferase